MPQGYYFANRALEGEITACLGTEGIHLIIVNHQILSIVNKFEDYPQVLDKISAFVWFQAEKRAQVTNV